MEDEKGSATHHQSYGFFKNDGHILTTRQGQGGGRSEAAGGRVQRRVVLEGEREETYMKQVWTQNKNITLYRTRTSVGIVFIVIFVARARFLSYIKGGSRQT